MSDINEMNVGVRWYVVHTYSGYENKVMTNLVKIVENRGLSKRRASPKRKSKARSSPVMF